ncbi:MAG: peptidoglycan-binding protein [Proteobacteria bacterium]|nr:peptidoglycan-binding protein [Pseudomonadota bacterium]
MTLTEEFDAMTMYPTATYADFKGPSFADRFRNVMHPVRWFRRRLLRKPGSTLGMGFAVLLGTGIVVNAVALQTERHPAPMFTTLIETPQVQPVQSLPTPPVRPQTAERRVDPAATAAVETAPAARPRPAPAADAPARAQSGRDQMLAIIKQGSEPEEKDTINRTLLVQKALNRAGYGPLKEDGAFGPGTRQALEKFESDRKLPQRGEATGRTARELSRVSGISIE